MLKVIVRGRKCEKYLEKCLFSIMRQGYRNFRCVIIIDQHLPSYLKAERIIQGDDRFSVFHNDRRMGLAYNICYGISLSVPTNEDVLAIVDADDWLHEDAFEVVMHKYAHSPNCLLTYGSYVKVSKARRSSISAPYRKDANVRKEKWHASHLKTFKYKLYKHLPLSYMKDAGGEWLEAASDLAVMIPLMELAGLDRCVHVPEEIYYYRDNADHKTDRALQIRCEKIVRAKLASKRAEI